MRTLELAGQVFGQLTVVERVIDGATHSRWLCVCSCGARKVINGQNLKNGGTVSCGCKRVIGRPPLPGRTTAARRTWGSMMARCFTVSNSNYLHYGAAGITVCDRWRSFDNFLAEMGERPFPNATIDRIDSSGNYEPSNCRWATPSEQIINRRNMPTIYNLYGERITISAIANHLAIERHALRNLLRSSGVLVGRYCREI